MSKLGKIASKVANKMSKAEAEKVLAKLLPEGLSKVEHDAALERLFKNPEDVKAVRQALDITQGANRAKDLGFDEQVWYHGAHRNIKEFKPEKASPEGFMGKSVYLTNDPADASWNYAHPEGPDIKSKIERLAERYQSEKDMNYTAAMEKAYKKVIGDVDSGAVYPLRTRAEKIADLDSSRQWIDLNPQYDEAGELVSENPIAQRIAEGIQQRATDAESRLEGDRILSNVELYDEKTPRQLYENVRKAAGEREISDKTGGLLSQEFARGALEDAGFDAAKVNAYEEFSMPNTNPDTEHLMVFDPAKIRSTNALFDKRYKDSPNILAATGSQKPSLGQQRPRYAGDSIAQKMQQEQDAESQLQQQYGTPGQQMTAFTEGVIRGALPVVGQKLLTGDKDFSGRVITEADLKGREEANPITYTVGNILGTVASPVLRPVMGAGNAIAAGIAKKLGGGTAAKVAGAVGESVATAPLYSAANLADQVAIGNVNPTMSEMGAELTPGTLDFLMPAVLGSGGAIASKMVKGKGLKAAQQAAAAEGKTLNAAEQLIAKNPEEVLVIGNPNKPMNFGTVTVKPESRNLGTVTVAPEPVRPVGLPNYGSVKTPDMQAKPVTVQPPKTNETMDQIVERYKKFIK